MRLREKRELDETESTDVRERGMERKIKVKKSDLERTRQNAREHAREQEKSEIESVHPLGYFCCSNNSLAAAEAPVGLQLCRPPRQSCNNLQSCSGCMLAA